MGCILYFDLLLCAENSEKMILVDSVKSKFSILHFRLYLFE